jgi:hypothetical protein
MAAASKSGIVARPKSTSIACAATTHGKTSNRRGRCGPARRKKAGTGKRSTMTPVFSLSCSLKPPRISSRPDTSAVMLAQRPPIACLPPAILATLLVAIGIRGTTAAGGPTAPPPLLTRRNHRISEQHFGLKRAAGFCHNDELDRKRDDKLVSTTTDAELIQFARIGFAASGASAACSARDPAPQTGLP